jgi:SAM-dependent methyltransferase
MRDARRYFQFLAELGLTKHIGSMQATRELIELCHIRGGAHVLDLGCGVGPTPCYLAQELGCRVVGVDLLDGMVRQARERARAGGVEDLVTFLAADARELPFAEGRFDAVIMESLNVFFDDKSKAMAEYVRVAKPGGYVGMTEMTWLRPPPPETAAYYRRVVYADALEAGGWRDLLADAGLVDVVGHAYPVDFAAEAKGRFERYGCRGIGRAMLRTARALVQDPSSRAFLADVTGNLPQDMMEDMGYGVYAGRKEAPLHPSNAV